MAQAEGLVGKLVDGMIRRSVRRTFRNVYWRPPSQPLQHPSILACSHHGWHDGYVMYHAITRLGFECVDWVQEFDAFPLFARVGGMPFPAGDATRRGATIKRTIRLMREGRKSLVMFAEGVLHDGPTLLPFGKALTTVAKSVEGCRVVPVAIRYVHGVHERPEAWISFADPLPPEEPDIPLRARLAVARELDRLEFDRRHQPEVFQVLAKGTPDVNERWDMRRIPGRTPPPTGK